MKFKKRLSSLLLAVTLATTSTFSYAASAKDVVTLEDAIFNGIENSKELDQVEIEIDLAKVSEERGAYKSKKLRRSNKDLKDAIKDLNAAQNALDSGFAPDGTHIDSLPIPDEQKQAMKDQIQAGIDSGRDQVDRGDIAIASALDQAGIAIGDALDFASLSALTIDSSADLLELMPKVASEVTQASFDIYKNSVALLIQKSYYDVLQAQELLKVKEAAMARGKKQYEFAKASYEEGMKPKDDMLMAEVYYKATKIAFEKAKGDYESAMIELKKNANYKMDKEIALENVAKREAENFDLNKGLQRAMENRLEIKKSVGEVLIFSTNFAEVSSSYTPNTFQYREAELLKDKAGVKYELAKKEVESSVRKSYELVKSTADMLKETDGIVEDAKESLEIAEARYMEGFGVDTSLLASLNLEQSAGTILEVLAAEEKLTEAQESIVKVTYAYNLARVAYKNNIGDFIY